MKIKILPIDNRFKRLINDFGSEWEIISGPHSMVCFSGDIGISCSPINNKVKISNFRLTDINMG